MSFLSVLIVEDEFIIAQDLKAALLSNGYSVFGIARSYKQAIELLKKGKPDFALIDITLSATGGQTGIELGKMFDQDLKIPFIYVTSHGDIATLEKVKLTNPSGYLLKPFRREAIYAAVEVARNNHKQTDANSNDGKFVTVKKGEEKLRIRYSEILYLESDGDYTNIITVMAKFTERKTLKLMLDEIGPETFVRVHKSYAVNKHKIHHFTREKIFLGSDEIPIGRTYAEEIVKMLQ